MILRQAAEVSGCLFQMRALLIQFTPRTLCGQNIQRRAIFNQSISPPISESQTYTTYHPPRLLDKVAIVTGSSSGLGRAIALQYASHGTKLVVCADLRYEPRPGGVEANSVPTHDVINSSYGDGKAIFVEADVNNAKDVEAMVETAVQKAGRVDMYVVRES